MKNRWGATDARGVCAHSHALPHKPPPGSQENEEARAAGESTPCWGVQAWRGDRLPYRTKSLRHTWGKSKERPLGER